MNLYRFARVCTLMFSVVLLSACSETLFVSHYAKQVPWPGEQVPGGNYKVGKPYKVDGEWYYPSEDFSKQETGIASWYGPTFHGKRTANGEIYDQNELTAAHRTLQMPSLVRVTNLDNGRSIVVRINDRGPFKRGRVIDVSKRAAELLGFIKNGTARVRLEVLEKESRKIAQAAQQGMDTSRITMADLNRIPDTQPVASYQPVNLQKREVDMASLRGSGAPGPRFGSSSDDPMLPESLRTPTITVEEINAGPSQPRNGYQGSWQSPPRQKIAAYGGQQAATAPQPEFSGHMDKGGRFMPDAVVQNTTAVATSLFVQAGSFGVYENAQRFSQQLNSIAPTVIEPINVNGRKLYRVKLGPLADITEADAVLARVAQAGTRDAKVIGAAN